MKTVNFILILLLILLLLFSCEKQQSNIIDGNFSEEDISKMKEMINFLNDISEEDISRINELIEFMNDYKIFSEKMVDAMDNMVDKILINKADIEELKRRIDLLEPK